MSKRTLTPPLFLMAMVRMIVDFGEEMEPSLQKGLTNLEKNLGARLPNALESLEGGDVGFNFQLKMLEFMASVNQELESGKEKRA